MIYQQRPYEKLIEIIKGLALDSWEGKTGEKRAEEVEKFVRNLTKHYAKVLGFSEEKILNALEARRDYSAINYYQEANFPTIDEAVEVFNNKKDFFGKFPSKKYLCPNCESVSTDPQTCNSGKTLKDKKVCDWKSYGLFGTMGKGYRFVVKETFLEDPVIYEIFKPIEI